MSQTRSARTPFWRELGIVFAISALLAVALTYPIAFRIGSVGRIDNGDGQFSIWNVAWVARTLVVDPRHVFDANIFYPNRRTLAYSENNLGAGVMAIPAYWATGSAYVAHNSVVLTSFALSFVGMYFLVRHLAGDRRAAAIAAIGFAFTPYLFAHMPHIQLLLIAGLPFSMLALHRLVDRPTPGRGAALGLAMAAQAICCGYYGVFVILTIGFGVLVLATARRLWLDRRFWAAILVAAAVSVTLVLPPFLPYVNLQQAQGFRRELANSRQYSANWSDYLASSSHAHAWMLDYLPPWTEASFPGFVMLGFGVAGFGVAWRNRRRDVVALYGGLALLAFWASFGPKGLLYSGLYRAIPFFGWLRAPSRFGLIVAFGLAVLGGVAIAALLRRARYATAVATVLAVATVAELRVHLELPELPAPEPVYRTLATLPPGPVIEMPFFYIRAMFPRHTYYMLQSTLHWMPLLNGYSDHTPPDFQERADTLKFFPSEASLKMLRAEHARYAVLHMYWYNAENQRDVFERLEQFEHYLRPLYTDADTRLYEIVGAPP